MGGPALAERLRRPCWFHFRRRELAHLFPPLTVRRATPRFSTYRVLVFLFFVLNRWYPYGANAPGSQVTTMLQIGVTIRLEEVIPHHTQCHSCHKTFQRNTHLSDCAILRASSLDLLWNGYSWAPCVPWPKVINRKAVSVIARVSLTSQISNLISRVSGMNVFGTKVCHLYVHRCFIKDTQPQSGHGRSIPARSANIQIGNLR